MLEPLVLLGGLVVIEQFMYRFKMSVAYYEMMLLDVARVVYDREEGKRVTADRESIRLNEEAAKRARERYEGKQNEWKAGRLSELNTNT